MFLQIRALSPFQVAQCPVYCGGSRCSSLPPDTKLWGVLKHQSAQSNLGAWEDSDESIL